MSFTSHIVRIGEGWEGPGKLEEDPSTVYTVHNIDAAAVGAEGSSDDSKSLFTDTYVDMAKEVSQEAEREEQPPKRFFKRKKKFYN